MNISEAMIQRLAALGVTYAAGVAGGGIMFLVDAIARSSLKVRYLCLMSFRVEFRKCSMKFPADRVSIGGA